jgi:ribosomal protein S18 acetylase RimI-like enzyme
MPPGRRKGFKLPFSGKKTFMEVKLRKIRVEDASILSGIAKQSFFDTFIGTCTEGDMQFFLEEYFNPDRLAKEIATAGNRYFFAEADGIPVGYLQFMEDYSGFPLMKKWRSLELKRIYVLKPFYGRGIAQHMMDFFMDYAKQHHYEAVWLGVWEHNVRAKRFYEKYGFAASGHTHDFPIGSTPQTDEWLWKFF